MLAILAAQAAALPSAPSTCQELKAINPDYPDGLYTLTLHIDAVATLTADVVADPNNWPLRRHQKRDFEVYCHNMNSTAIAYLKVDPTTNYATWVYGNASYTTRFEKVRFDERKQMLYSADYTFSTLDTTPSTAPDPCSQDHPCGIKNGTLNYKLHCVDNGGSIEFRAPLGSAANLWDPSKCDGNSACTQSYDIDGALTRAGQLSVNLTGLPGARIAREPAWLVWNKFINEGGDILDPLNRDSGYQPVQGDKNGDGRVLEVSVPAYKVDSLFGLPVEYGCLDTAGFASGEVLSSQFGLPSFDMSKTSEIKTCKETSSLRAVYNIDTLIDMDYDAELAEVFEPPPTDGDDRIPWYEEYCNISESLSSFPRGDEQFPTELDTSHIEEYLGAGGWGMPLCLGDSQDCYNGDQKLGPNACNPINCLTDSDSRWHKGKDSTAKVHATLKHAARKVPSMDFGPVRCDGAADYHVCSQIHSTSTTTTTDSRAVSACSPEPIRLRAARFERPSPTPDTLTFRTGSAPQFTAHTPCPATPAVEVPPTTTTTLPEFNFTEPRDIGAAGE